MAFMLIMAFQSPHFSSYVKVAVQIYMWIILYLSSKKIEKQKVFLPIVEKLYKNYKM